jgi:hypothetical protein
MNHREYRDLREKWEFVYKFIMYEVPIKQVNIPKVCPRCKREVLDKKPYCKNCNLFFELEIGKKVTKGKCLYCSYQGILSQEHVLPSWLSNIFPPDTSYSYGKIQRPDFRDFNKIPDVNEKTYERNCSIYDSKVYNVCKECNNGWMSNLQNLAKYIVTKIGKGEWKNSTRTQQSVLSRWIAMISLNMHSQLKSIQTFEIDLQRLKDGEIPSGWQIYVARLLDDKLSGNRFCMQGYVPIAVGETALTYNLTYFCIGKAIFLTINSFSDYSTSHIKYGQLPIDQILESYNFRSIWPKNESALKTKGTGLDPTDILNLHCLLGRL